MAVTICIANFELRTDAARRPLPGAGDWRGALDGRPAVFLISRGSERRRGRGWV